MGEGQVAQACPKFADSNKLDPSSGTLINLGACYEKLGRSASAWVAYQEAASMASSAGRQDHLRIAQKRAQILEPTLAHVVVSVPTPVEGLEVRRDGVPVVPAEYGLAVPIDSGAHVYEAIAPGYKPWKGNLEVVGDNAKAGITIPVLEKAPVVKLKPGANPNAWRPLRTVALVSGGIGVVGLALGSVFGLEASSSYNASLANCRSSNKNLCTPDGVSKRNDAISQGNISTVAFVVGGVAAAAGVGLWLFAPPAREGQTQARMFVAPTLNGAMVRGEW